MRNSTYLQAASRELREGDGDAGQNSRAPSPPLLSLALSLSHTQCGRWRVEKWQCLPSTIGCAHPCRQLLTIGYELRLSANVYTFAGRKRDKEKTEGGRGRERRSRLHHSIQVTYTDSMRLEHSQMGMLIAKERLADVGEVVGREAVKLFSKAADDFSQNLGGLWEQVQVLTPRF